MAQKIGFGLIVLLVFAQCGKYNRRVSKQETLPYFHTLDLESSFEIELLESKGNSIEIDAAEAYMNDIQFEVVDSVLTIHNLAKGKWLHPKHNKIKLRISCEQLKLINAQESCHIQTIEPITTYEFGIIIGGKVNMADLEFNNSVVYCWNYFPCGGTLTFRGSAQTLKIWSTALMSVDAQNLAVQNAFIEHRGKNDLSMTVSSYLRWAIMGNGNIHCYGSPTQIEKVEDSGEGELVMH